ncbi:hypothetical protein M011DRAFT_476093 [Sporormia fimetaria CBS 119925]|uniref:Uncharacterized protein n=1 Tax=Sporormia fimetaria CBS 119925 TaxID=1340428 RepID=A0A6A6VHM6_9PLEO|nr:hypothetical protein M011DRAFT_476093 [Sporormia fimetaria CBS 119925]
MAPRFMVARRLPITAAFTARRTPAAVRFNSQSTASTAAQVVEMARAANKPSALETAVPVAWFVTGLVAWMTFNRVDDKDGEYVEKLLVV